MRTKTPSRAKRVAVLERVVKNGRRMVVLEEAEYERLRDKADEWEPLMPEPNEHGNYPALEAMRVSIARSLLRHRRRVGLTQAELARRAGIRVETLNRLEHAKHSPTVATIEKIERALKKADIENRR